MIWKNAPSWANVYLKHKKCPAFAAFAESHEDGSRVVTTVDGREFKLIADCWDLVATRNQSTESKDHKADQLPPVGEPVELMWSGDTHPKWTPATVLYTNDDLKIAVIDFTSNGGPVDIYTYDELKTVQVRPAIKQVLEDYGIELTGDYHTDMNSMFELIRDLRGEL